MANIGQHTYDAPGKDDVHSSLDGRQGCGRRGDDAVIAAREESQVEAHKVGRLHMVLHFGYIAAVGHTPK